MSEAANINAVMRTLADPMRRALFERIAAADGITVVSWTLTKVDNGTRLRLVHSGFVTPTNDSAFKSMSGAWKAVVNRVGAMAGDQHRTDDKGDRHRGQP
jgi:uncharacterized protein YndB with AHSA1/START domain